jgi:hypothetical protein
MSVLESILSRAERQVQEEGARIQARNGAKREKRGPRYDDEPDYGAPRIKRRRSDRDSDYSPYGGSQRQSRIIGDDDHRHGRPFSSSSSGDDNAERNCSSSSRGSSKQGVAGMKEVLYKRRHASPEQVLLEQVFAVEPSRQAPPSSGCPRCST